VPSRSEPFGVAFLEAAACGCPVIALDRAAAREIVIPGVTGTLLAEAEPGPLADAMVAWLTDPQALARAGRAAQERVAFAYTWELAAARILEAFDRARGAPAERRAAAHAEEPRGWRPAAAGAAAGGGSGR
jgi:glycosyltransferase involved in cell wall biosynthesis